MMFNANHDLLWNTVSGDHEFAQKQASLTHAKVAVAQYWPFLSRATSVRDFENRLSLTQDRIAALVPAETYEDVLNSLRSDFRAVAGKGENPFAKDDDKDDDSDSDDDKDSSDSSDSDADKDDDKDDSDDDSDDKDSGSDSDSKSDSDDDSDDASDDSKDSKGADDDHKKPDFWKDKQKEATNYRPDPTAGWRYHPGYEQLRAPVDNGALQDSDGFVADLAQGEGRANEVIEQRQLTPGVWTQHDGMPERPMPQGQQRGYMPVNAKFDKQGYLIETPVQRVAKFDAQGFLVEAYYSDDDDLVKAVTENAERAKRPGHYSENAGLVRAVTEGEEAHQDQRRQHARAASQGRGVEPLQDPAPGTPQRHNPFYFQQGSNVGGNDGFPTDPSSEPLLNNMDEFYGEGAPQQSSGSTEGQVDGQGYSRESSLRYDAEGYLVESPNFT